VKISVIIPAFNEAAILSPSIASVQRAAAAFDAAGLAWELIVCDNNSSDRTADIAAAAGARVVFEPVNQIARARNSGAAHATGEWLLFIDADSHPSPELFADVAREIVHGGTLAGSSTMAVDSRLAIVRFVVASWNALSRVMKWGAGSFVFCRADVFRAAGGFDQSLYVSEDVAFFWALKRLPGVGRRRMAILSRHPVMTSARKAHLYTPAEFAAFYWRMLISGGRTMRRADDCPIWYDGRR
jgi:glycosyltransferase involved in cell wall biosynthesis